VRSAGHLVILDRERLPRSSAQREVWAFSRWVPRGRIHPFTTCIGNGSHPAIARASRFPHARSKRVAFASPTPQIPIHLNPKCGPWPRSPRRPAAIGSRPARRTLAANPCEARRKGGNGARIRSGAALRRTRCPGPGVGWDCAPRRSAHERQPACQRRAPAHGSRVAVPGGLRPRSSRSRTSSRRGSAPDGPAPARRDPAQSANLPALLSGRDGIQPPCGGSRGCAPRRPTSSTSFATS
jgi:hypothetical protein